MAGQATSDLQSALGRFGLSEFRRGQREVIDHILAGNDCLCVMPTGGGKSLCYQLPSIVRNGLTIVVSPLIALMKDQVDALARRGIPATLINSTLSLSEQNYRLERVASGNYSLVYVAPERLRNQQFVDAIRSTPVQLLAIDEAHCISEWGHDFRPDYQRVGRFREALGGVQTVALTATATPRVRQDIVDSLKLRVAKHFITGFARDNLYFGVAHCHSDRDKDKKLLQFLEKKPGSGIVYAATRKRCEALVELIAKEAKISVGAYHAGLAPDQRKFIQEQFMKGELEAIVATNAFGMGIDKSDLRYVIHYNMPGTIEAYYQEAGRAGRDGLPSQCVLLYSPQDRYIQEFFIENANPSKEIIQTVYEFLIAQENDPIELTAEEIKERVNAPVSSEAINSCLQLLGRTEVIERLEMSGGLAMVRIASKLPSLVDFLPKEANVKRSVLRAVEKAVGDRRDEAVYINPRLLMQQLQMERDTLSRHLRDLCQLQDFEYVPPFRGRAIHVRSRDVAFANLGIDHKTLEERKKSDYEKLDKMVAYTQARDCRQRYILEYFGDGSASNCNICDRCHGKTGWVPLPKRKEEPDKSKNRKKTKQEQGIAEQALVPQIEEGPAISQIHELHIANVSNAQTTGVASANATDEKLKAKNGQKKETSVKASSRGTLEPTLTPVQQECARQIADRVLSAIDRTHGYLSKSILAQFFSGIENRAIQGLRLTRLPEFGLLKHWKKSHVSSLLDLFLDETLLLLTELRTGKVTVSVGPMGTECKDGTAPYPVRILTVIHVSDQNDKSKTQTANLVSHSENSEPSDTAPSNGPSLDSKSIGGLVSVDCENKTDKTVSNEAPSSNLDQIRTESEWLIANSSDAGSVRDPLSPTIEDWRWTARLAQHGYRLGEIALIRGKQPDQILMDLCSALSANETVSIEHLFDRRTQIAIRELQSQGFIPNSPPAAFSSFPSLWDFMKRWLGNQPRQPVFIK